MGEPSTFKETLKAFVLRRLGTALPERSTVKRTLLSRLSDLVKQLEQRERRNQTEGGPGKQVKRC
jgi:hypothetical protein